MGFTEELADIGDPIWDAVVDHPIVEQSRKNHLTTTDTGGDQSW